MQSEHLDYNRFVTNPFRNGFAYFIWWQTVFRNRFIDILDIYDWYLIVVNTRGKIKFKIYLFYNDYKTTYINHARSHRCLLSGGLRVGGNRSTRRKFYF